MQKFLRTLMLAALMLPFVSQAQTMYLTVADSTATNNYVPVYGLYMDDPLGCQSIYPASMLTDMIGENILSLHYYVSTGGSSNWGTDKPMLVKMMVVTESDLSTGYIDVTNATTVYNGTISAGDATVADGFTVDFTTPFMYTGGNLLISFQINPNDVGGYTSISWYGKNINGASRSGSGATNYDFSASGTVRNFLPKTTFTYGTAPTCFKVTAQTIDATQTTANSLTLTWTDALNTTATYSVYNMSDTSLIQSGITALTYTVNNLTPNTAYSFGIQTDCGGGDIANGYAIVNGRTACSALATLPYTCGFEANEILATTPNVDALPFCWNRYASGSGSYTYYPYSYSSSSYAHNGSRLLYFYDGTSTTYPDTMVAILPELDVTTYPMNGNRLTFWGRVSTGTNTKNVQVGTMTNPADMSTFVPVSTVAVSGTTHTMYSVPLSSASATAPYVAIMLVRSSSGYLCIDDVTLEEMPSCVEVTSLATSNITSSSVTLSWTDNGNSNATYTVYNMADTSIIASNLSTPNYLVDNLNANTQYLFGVQANCTSGDAAIMTVSARTSCAAEELPFTEDFSASLASDPCWRGASGVTAAEVFAGASLNLVAPNWTYASSVNSGIEAGHYYKNIYGTSCKSWIITPTIDLSTATSAQLSFDAVFTGYNSASAASGFESNSSQAFMVIVSADGGNTWLETNATKWQNEGGNYTLASLAGTSYMNQVINLNAYLGDTIRIAFYAQSTTSGGDNNLHIDNIAVTEVPGCPNVMGLTLDSSDASSAYVSWNDNGASNYEVEVRQNDVPLTTVSVNVVDTTATITGLAIDNDYQIVVRAICGSDYGQWTSPLNIHIGYCLPTPTSVDNNGVTSVCFGGMTNTTSHAGSTAAYVNNSTMAGSVPAGTTASVDITYATGYTYGTIIWVDWNDNMSFEGTEVVYAGESTNSNPTTLTATFDIPATQATGNYRMRILAADMAFDSYTSSIADAANANPCATFSYGIAEDYTLTVADAPSCMAISNLAVDSVSATSVSISWSDNDNTGATYSIYGSTGSVIASGITTTSYTITGLTASTSYTFGVVANCSATETSDVATITAVTDCAGGSCLVSIYAQDGYGDGWENSTITISQNGATVATYNMADQNETMTTIYDTFQISVCSGIPVTFSWTSGSNYDDEASFQIVDGGGAVVYTVSAANTLTDNAVFYTLNDPCPSCATPAVTVDAATENSITISWTGSAASYDVYNGTTFVANVTTNTYTFTGLTPATNYTLGVVANCSATDTSVMATVTVGTSCGVISTFPYTQDFSAVPACWNAIDADGDGYNWSLISGAMHSASYENYVGPLTPNNWLITPQFQLAANTSYEVTWNADPQDVDYPAEHYGLYVSTTTADTSAFTLVQEWTLTAAGHVPVVDLSTYAGQTIYLAFRHWNCTDMYRIAIDNFQLREAAGANQITVTLTQNNPMYGSVAGGGVYNIGDSVTVTATPNTSAGYQFEYWMSNMGSIVYANPYTFVAATDITLQAIFSDGTTPALDSMQVNIAVNDPTMGTTNPAPGVHYFYTGQDASVIAIPNNGYHLEGWSIMVVSDGSTLMDTTFNYAVDDVFDLFGGWTVEEGDEDYVWTVTANFAAGTIEQHDSLTVITACNNEAWGTITPAAGTHYYVEGDTVIVGAIPNDGYYVSMVITATTVPGIGEFVDTLYAEDLEDEPLLDTLIVDEEYMGMILDIKVIFAPVGGVNTYTVTVNYDPTMGTVEGIPTEPVAAGTQVTLTARANEGYHFSRWSNGETSATITITVTSDITLEAFFERNTGIEDATAVDFNVYGKDGRIMLQGAEGREVYVFDVNGRMLHHTAVANMTESYNAPATGLYIVKVMGVGTKRVVIVR